MSTDLEKFEAERRRRAAFHHQLVEIIRASWYKRGNGEVLLIHTPTLHIEAILDLDRLADLIERATNNKGGRSRSGCFTIKTSKPGKAAAE